MPDTPNSPIYPNIQQPSTTSISNIPAPNIQPQEQVSAFDKAFASAQVKPLQSQKYVNPALETPLDITLRYDDPIYGYSALNPDTEAQYADRQHWYSSFGNNILKFGANTLSTIGSTFAAIPYGIKAIADGKMSEIYNNPVVNGLNDWTEGLENTLPSYIGHYEAAHPVLSAINPFKFGAFANTWGGVIKNLGFVAGDLASAAIVDTLVGLATGGAGDIPLIALQAEKLGMDIGRFSKLAGAGGDAMNSFNLALQAGEDVTSAVNKLARAAKINNNIKYGLSLFSSTVGQSALIANNTYTSANAELTTDYINKYGITPSGAEADKIDKLAIGAANTNLIANMAIMSIGHAYSLKSFFSPTAQAIQQGVQQEIASGIKLAVNPNNIDEILNVTPKLGRVKGFLSSSTNIGKVIGVNALQGGGLFFTDNAVKSYIKRKYDDETVNDFDNVWKSLGDGFKNTLLTPEGQQSVEMGALTGALIHAGTGIFQRIKGADTNKTRVAQSILSTLNDQGVTSLFEHTYNEGLNAASIAGDMETAAKNNDPFQYKNLQLQSLFNFVNGATKVGRFDLRIEQLKGLKDLTQQQFETMFQLKYTDENRRVASDYVDSLIKKAFDVKKTINKVDEAFPNPYNPKKDKVNFDNHSDYKDALALTLAHLDDNRNRMRDLHSEISNIFPTVSTDKIIDLTNEDGIQKTIKTFESRIKELNTGKDLLKGTGAEDLKNAHDKEIAFLEEKLKFLKSNKELNIDENGQFRYSNEHVKSVGEILDYYKNNDLSAEKSDSLSILSSLEKARDIYKLGYFSNEAVNYYNTLASKSGYEKFSDFVTGLKQSNDSKIEIGANGEFTYVTPEILAQREADVKEKERLQFEAAHNEATPPEPATEEEKKKLDEIVKKEKAKQQLTPEEETLKQEKKQAYTNKKKADAKADQKEYDDLTFEDQLEVDYKTELEKVGKEGETVKGKIDGKNVTITQGKVTGENVNASYRFDDGTGGSSGNMSIVDIKKAIDAKFGTTQPETKTEVVPVKTESDKQYKGASPTQLVHNVFNPKGEQQAVRKENLFKRLFKAAFPEKIKEGLSLKIAPSETGKAPTEFSKEPIVPGTKLYRRGYDTNISVLVDGKEVGQLQDNLYFDREGKKVPILELQKDEYVDVTGNDLTTYDSFMKEMNDYQKMVDIIKDKYSKGEVEISNKDLQGIIGNVSIFYGLADYVDTPQDATLLKNAKYIGKDSYVLSYPYITDAVTGERRRSEHPVIIGEKGVVTDVPADVRKFLEDNADQVKNLNRRYVVLMRMPDGTFTKASPIAARPTIRPAEGLDTLLKALKGGNKDEIAQELDKIYIADAANRTSYGNKIQFKQTDTGEFTLNVENSRKAKKISKVLPISKAEIAATKSVEALVDLFNSKIKGEKDLKSLKIELRMEDIKSNVLKDENTNFNDLKDKLTIATTTSVFKDSRISIKPKSDEIAPSVEAVKPVEATIDEDKQALINNGSTIEEVDKLTKEEVKEQAEKVKPDIRNNPLNKNNIATVLARAYRKLFNHGLTSEQVAKFNLKLVEFSPDGYLKPEYIQSILNGKGQPLTSLDTAKKISDAIGKVRGNEEFHRQREYSPRTPPPVNELKTSFDILQEIRRTQERIDRSEDKTKVAELDKRVDELDKKLNKESEEYKRAKTIFDNFESITRELEKDGDLKIDCS